MTGNNVVGKATYLLGYTDKNGQSSEENIIKSRALEFINQISLDLGGDGQLKALYDIINIGKECEEALVYGVAMMLALSVGDSEKNSVFAKLYNLKRASAKFFVSSKKDSLPVTDGGE